MRGPKGRPKFMDLVREEVAGGRVERGRRTGAPSPGSSAYARRQGTGFAVPARAKACPLWSGSCQGSGSAVPALAKGEVSELRKVRIFFWLKAEHRVSSLSCAI